MSLFPLEMEFTAKGRATASPDKITAFSYLQTCACYLYLGAPFKIVPHFLGFFKLTSSERANINTVMIRPLLWSSSSSAVAF